MLDETREKAVFCDVSHDKKDMEICCKVDSCEL